MAVKSRTQINTDATTLLPDNTSAEISPADVRGRVQDLADSALFPEDLAVTKETATVGTAIDFKEGTNNGSHAIKVKAPDSIPANATVTLPNGAGTIARIEDLGPYARVNFQFNATAGQTTFSGLDQNSNLLTYTPQFLDVFVNGRIVSPADYTASSGSTIVFSTGLTLGDEVFIATWRASTTITGSRNIFRYNATASQTTFSGADANSNTLSYVTGQIDVFVNGRFIAPTDYTANNGTSVVFTVGRSATDEVIIIAYAGMLNFTEWTPASTAGSARLRFGEDTDNGTHAVTVQAPTSLSANFTITWPAITGTVVVYDGSNIVSLPSGASLNFNSGDVIIAHSADRLDLSGANVYAFNQNGFYPSIVINRTDNHGTDAVIGIFQFYGMDSAVNSELYAQIQARALVNTNGSELGGIDFFAKNAATQTHVLRIQPGLIWAPSSTTLGASGARFAGILVDQIQLGHDSDTTLTRLAPGVIGVEGTEICPIGSLMDFAGSTPPAGWIFCFGQNLNRTTYAKLFAVIQTAFGAGDGSTTFGVPDLRGRVVAGKDNMGGTSADRLTSPINGDNLGAAGGSQSHALITAELPAHNHGVTDPGHAHNFGISLQGVTGSQLIGSGAVPAFYAAGADTRSGTQSSGTGISIQNTGSGTAHNNMQPTMVLNKIMYAGV
jgi:microcystin-dependent protein